jgi:FkbM family methyltransferase
MDALKTFAFQMLKWIVKPFIGLGLGRHATVSKIYTWVMDALKPRSMITINNYKMNIYQDKYKWTDDITAELLFKGTWEPYTTEVFKQILREEMVAVDIGANIGYYSLLAASLVGAKGKVYAFEPEPQNYALLIKNISANGYTNIEAYRKAVSRSAGRMALYVGTQSGTHSLFNVRETTTKSVMVDLISLDEFFREKKKGVDIIKLDVQGAEMDVLMGMQNVIKGNDHLKLLTEFEPDLAHTGFSLKEYWNRLIESGFRHIYLINEQERKLDLSDFQYCVDFCNKKHVASVNLLCSKYPENIELSQIYLNMDKLSQ